MSAYLSLMLRGQSAYSFISGSRLTILAVSMPIVTACIRSFCRQAASPTVSNCQG